MIENVLAILGRNSELVLEPVGVGDVLKQFVDINTLKHYLALLKYSKSDIHDILNNKFNYGLREYINFSKITKKPVFYFEKIHETYLKGY